MSVPERLTDQSAKLTEQKTEAGAQKTEAVAWSTSAKEELDSEIKRVAVRLSEDAQSLALAHQADRVSAEYVAQASRTLRLVRKSNGADVMLAIGPTLFSLGLGPIVTLILVPLAVPATALSFILLGILVLIGAVLTTVAATAKRLG